MANQEQLKILKQGVKVWNKWREEYPDEEIDLSYVDLSGAMLSRADLSNARLSRANLSGADLTWADLSKATLSETILSGAKLIRADLSKAVLFKAFLDGANLIQTQLREANITGAYLYGTAREDWIIDGILCDYVFWDEEGKQRTPKDGNFQSGEFEELYKYLPTFEYIFEKGISLIDMAVLDRIINELHIQHPAWQLKIDSVHSRGQSHAKFTVNQEEFIKEALKQIATRYETKIKVLEGRETVLMELIAKFIDRPQLQVTIGELTEGDKVIGRDSIELHDKAHVKQLTTGNSEDETTREQ